MTFLLAIAASVCAMAAFAGLAWFAEWTTRPQRSVLWVVPFALACILVVGSAAITFSSLVNGVSP